MTVPTAELTAPHRGGSTIRRSLTSSNAAKTGHGLSRSQRRTIRNQPRTGRVRCPKLVPARSSRPIGGSSSASPAGSGVRIRLVASVHAAYQNDPAMVHRCAERLAAQMDPAPQWWAGFGAFLAERVAVTRAVSQLQGPQHAHGGVVPAHPPSPVRWARCRRPSCSRSGCACRGSTAGATSAGSCSPPPWIGWRQCSERPA